MSGITLHTNMNPAWRFYEVDTGGFNIYNAYTFNTYADKFDSLDVTKVVLSGSYYIPHVRRTEIRSNGLKTHLSLQRFGIK
jgi:spore germination protein YaaH